MSWSRAFHVPIPLPDGRMLRTLRDAGEYIQELPRATHQRPEWRIAAEMLLEAVEGKGPLMFAEIAMRKAVNAGKPAPEPTPDQEAPPAWSSNASGAMEVLAGTCQPSNQTVCT
jgi:hypothetical protein